MKILERPERRGERIKLVKTQFIESLRNHRMRVFLCREEILIDGQDTGTILVNVAICLH